MKFTEIDGLRYAVRCCDDCPFFNDGAGFEYLHTCQHPAWDRKEYMTISEFKTHEMYDELCPLGDSKLAEGGVTDPCGTEMVFFGPLDSEKEIVIPEHISEALGSLKMENEKPRRTRVMDDNSLCVCIHDAEGEQTVCMTIDQAVAMALWILRQNFALPPWWAARIRVLPPRRNGDEGTRAERP